ncbi:hypothetical protein [uncultured Deefgea sp.]|uniref:hypothetical protein n=1 Tax=uncultured Deefgea sp. TaxID=1304914 RepID=UPI00262B9CC8|nr:hypothetical protein [uncultured Deefgea sp.]
MEHTNEVHSVNAMKNLLSNMSIVIVIVAALAGLSGYAYFYGVLGFAGAAWAINAIPVYNFMVVGAPVFLIAIVVFFFCYSKSVSEPKSLFYFIGLVLFSTIFCILAVPFMNLAVSGYIFDGFFIKFIYFFLSVLVGFSVVFLIGSPYLMIKMMSAVLILVLPVFLMFSYGSYKGITLFDSHEHVIINGSRWIPALAIGDKLLLIRKVDEVNKISMIVPLSNEVQVQYKNK